MLTRGANATDVDGMIARFTFTVPGHPFHEPPSTSSSTNQVIAVAPGVGEGRPVLNILPEERVVDVASAAAFASSSSSPHALWVSVARKTGFRRLHRSGGCWYTAAIVEYPSCEEEAHYDKRCERCWGPPPGSTVPAAIPLESDASVDSSDESSSED